MELADKNIAVLVENLYQELEVWYPIFRFREAGANVTIVGPEAQKYSSKLGYPVVADCAAEDVKGKLFDAVVIPGGYAPDLIRLNPALVGLVRSNGQAGKVVAAICHGSWVLASANLLRGKRVTGAPSIRDDLTNAGGIYEDAEVVVEGNLITSRKPADLPAFCREIVNALKAGTQRAAA